MNDTIVELLDELLGLSLEIGDVGSVQMTVHAINGSAPFFPTLVAGAARAREP